jgi:crotonobetainyl-CoA:carnitine CoA-transferase CaiB-like acyl-CoA transferase
MLATGLPFTFSRSAIAPLAPAARLGEHTAEALREWLGLDAAEVETLEAQGGLV